MNGQVDPRLGVKPSPRVIADGQPVPTGGGYAMTGKPYVVAGRRYVPSTDPVNFTQVGFASWYGDAFHGRYTANHEIYDMNRLSAAHTTLPLPCYVRVTSLATGRSVVVRVNDRGPFHSNRIMDLSGGAARMLGVDRLGIFKIKIDYVGRAPIQGNDMAYLRSTYRGPGQGGALGGDGDFTANGPAIGSSVKAYAPALPRVAAVVPGAAGSVNNTPEAGLIPSPEGALTPPERPYVQLANAVPDASDPYSSYTAPNGSREESRLNTPAPATPTPPTAAVMPQLHTATMVRAPNLPHPRPLEIDQHAEVHLKDAPKLAANAHPLPQLRNEPYAGFEPQDGTAAPHGLDDGQ